MVYERRRCEYLLYVTLSSLVLARYLSSLSVPCCVITFVLCLVWYAMLHY